MHLQKDWLDSLFSQHYSQLFLYFVCGNADLYLCCDQFVCSRDVQSIKLVAIPNDFGMPDNIVELERYGGELCLLCFLKHGLHLKI